MKEAKVTKKLLEYMKEKWAKNSFAITKLENKDKNSSFKVSVRLEDKQYCIWFF